MRQPWIGAAWGLGLAGALVPPVLAQERCPTGADLAAGVRVAYEDGRVEFFRPGGAPGLVTMSGTLDDGSGFRNELVHGLLGVAAWSWLLRDRAPERPDWTYDYGLSPSEIPVPAPETTFASDVTVTSHAEELGGAAYVQTRSVSYGPMSRVELAGCSYDAIPTELVIGNPVGPAFRLGSHYLPELGFAVQDWWEMGDSSRMDEAVLSIEAKRG